MDVRRMVVNTPCPACQAEKLVYTAVELDIPYFGGVLESIVICGACGFKHSDVVIGKQHGALRHTVRVASAEGLSVRVVRSTSCTVRVPELGAKIEPGPNSEAYVSNTEGVLVRIATVLGQLARDAETDEGRQAAADRLALLDRMRQGLEPFTLILEDAYGNSVIGSEDVVVEQIPPEEAERLKTGELILDLSELAGQWDQDGHPSRN